MLKCKCGFSHPKPVYPVYCKCGKIHYEGLMVDALASNQPGTELSRLIAGDIELFGLHLSLPGIPSGGCKGCSDRISKMNSWGVAGCIENKKTIVGWLVEGTRGLFPGVVLGKLVDLAIYNAKHRKPKTLPKHELQPETIHPTRPLAVVSIASGSHLTTLEKTRPLRAAYASSVGADLVELTDDRWPSYPMYNKWRLYNVAKVYERVLYVDSDVIIQPNSPNIFSLVPSNCIAFFDEAPTVEENNQHGYFSDFKKVAAGRPIPSWCPNAGVLVLPQELAGLYKPPAEMENMWCMDQFVLALNCHEQQAPVFFLDQVWNWGWISQRFWEGLDHAHFIHLNGTSGSYREQLLDRILAGNYEPIEPTGWRPPR